MRTINIGESGLEGSAIVLGMMRITDFSTNDLSSFLHQALECGIHMMDHADIYGSGHCEELFGNVLKKEPGLRHKMIIQSKCGIRKDFFDFSKEYILEATDHILKRLQTDHLDVLLLHRPDALMVPEEVADAFNALHKAGKVLHFGVSNQNPAQIELLQNAVSQKLIINQLQFSCAHTGMLDNGIHVNMTDAPSVNHDGSVLEYCRNKQITIQTWSSLQYGFFEGSFLGNERYAKLNEVLMRIAKEYDVDAAAVAIAWILRHPAKMQAILGTTKISHLRSIVKASEIELSRPQWYEIYQAAGNRLP